MFFDSSSSYKFFQNIDNLEIFFFLALFFAVVIFASRIAILGVVEEITISEASAKFSLITSYSLNQIFLRAVYSFFFSIH